MSGSEGVYLLGVIYVDLYQFVCLFQVGGSKSDWKGEPAYPGSSSGTYIPGGYWLMGQGSAALSCSSPFSLVSLGWQCNAPEYLYTMAGSIFSSKVRSG